MKLVRLLLAAPILFVACGGAPEAARSPASTRDQDGVPDRAPQTIEEAEDQIADAQRRLSSGNTEESGEDAKASQSPPPPPPAPPSDRVAPGGGAPPKTKNEAPTDACTSPCRAFASMRRAVEALCRMTGETDERCVKARRTLETTNGRVASCRCNR